MSAVLDKSPAQVPAAELATLRGIQRPTAPAGRQEVLRLARLFLPEVLSFPTGVRSYWQRVIRAPLAELHAARGQVVAEFDKLTDIARRTAELLPEAAAVAGGPLPGSDDLPAARAELAKFVELILSRWKTEDDLAELIVDTFELPAWLREGRIPPHLRPPSSWYAESADPTRPANG